MEKIVGIGVHFDTAECWLTLVSAGGVTVKRNPSVASLKRLGAKCTKLMLNGKGQVYQREDGWAFYFYPFRRA